MSSALPGFLRAAAPATIQTDAAPLRCGSFRLAQQSAPWRYGLLHDRDRDFLLWITRGQGRVTIDGVRRGVSTGSAVFLPTGTLFSLDLPSTAQALYVESLPGLAKDLPAEPIHLRIADGAAQAELTGEIDAMAREVAARGPRFGDVLAARLTLIAVLLHRQAARGATAQPEATAATRLARRYARALVREYRSAQSMAAYADALDVTPTHLSRVCRSTCGKSAADMLTERKLHAARGALDRPGPAIKDIAAELGFGSAAYFSRFILSQTGQSPRALRAMGGRTRAHRD